MEVVLFTLPVVLGVALLWLARWARRRNLALHHGEGLVRYGDFVEASHQGKLGEAARLVFFGDLPKWQATAGRLMMWAVVLAVVAGAVAVAVLLFARFGVS